MKKFAFLPLAALLMLASCKSDDPTPRPEVPTDPVATVPSQADDVTLNAPEQYPDYELDGSLYRFTYANGQQISYTLTTDATQGNVARVRKIAGASEVIIPQWSTLSRRRQASRFNIRWYVLIFSLTQPRV